MDSLLPETLPLHETVFNILREASQRRDWYTATALEAFMWDALKYDRHHVFSAKEIEALDEDSYTKSLIFAPGTSLQDRWSSVAISEQYLHMHSFSQRQKFAAIGSSDTLDIIFKLHYTRINLLGAISNLRDQAVVMCRLGTLIMDTTRHVQYQDAANLFEKARKIAETNGFMCIEAMSCTGLGRIAFKEMRIPDALSLLRHAVVASDHSEVGNYTLKTDALYELAFVLGNIDFLAEESANIHLLAEFKDVVDVLWSLYMKRASDTEFLRLQPTYLCKKSPIKARECLEPFDHPRIMCVSAYEQARLFFVRGMFAYRSQQETWAISQIYDVLLFMNLSPSEGNRARDFYDLIKEIRAHVLTWSPTDEQQALLESVRLTTVILLSQMAAEKRRYGTSESKRLHYYKLVGEDA